MKTEKKSRIGRLFGNILNVKYWTDYNRVRSAGSYLLNSTKKLIIPQKVDPNKVEDFTVAKSRFKLTEKDLLQQQNSLYRLSIIMCVFALCLFIYAGYHVVYGSVKAVVISLVLTAIALVLAFRYHFWFFQIKSKKLGCSLSEWYHQGLWGKKP